MPYASEKIPLPEHLDRRRKLTSQDKERIRDEYQHGGRSLRSLAAEYGVCHKSILLIVNPDSKKKNDIRIKENWQKYVPSKEEHARIVREHRHYKHQLHLTGELVPPCPPTDVPGQVAGK